MPNLMVNTNNMAADAGAFDPRSPGQARTPRVHGAALTDITLQEQDGVAKNAALNRQQTEVVMTAPTGAGVAPTVKVDVIMLAPRSQDCKTYPLVVANWCDIGVIKHHFFTKFGIPVASQMLIHNGQQLSDFAKVDLSTGTPLFLHSPQLFSRQGPAPDGDMEIQPLKDLPPSYDDATEATHLKKDTSFIRQANGNPRSHHFSKGVTWSELSKNLDENEVKDSRRVFIRNVYFILQLQLLLTAGICACFMYIQPLQDAAVNNYYAFILVPLIPMIIVMVCMFKYKTVVPLNLALLVLFTVLQSLTVGALCGVYASAGYGILVLQAFIITWAIFFSLTIFVLQSKIDFTWLGAGLQSAVICLFVWGFFVWWFGYYAYMMYLLIGVFVFVGYILYDTSMILTRLGPEDTVIAAMELYLDFINLFVFILALLGGGKK